MLSCLLERRGTGWLKEGENENTSLGVKLVQIQSVPYMLKPEKETLFLMGHTVRKKGQRLADFFANGVVNLSVTERGPSFMTFDLRRRGFSWP